MTVSLCIHEQIIVYARKKTTLANPQKVNFLLFSVDVLRYTDSAVYSLPETIGFMVSFVTLFITVIFDNTIYTLSDINIS